MNPAAHSTAPTLQQLTCRLVRDAADVAHHHAIRRAVFVDEQRLFAHSDQDGHDSDFSTLHVVGFLDGRPAGAVRVYPLDPLDPHGDWRGDRLAVLAPFRTSGRERSLVRFAVAAAAARGGRRMTAHVQAPNRAFFRRLGWTEVRGPQPFHGRPHLLMDVDLSTVDRSVLDPAALNPSVLTASAEA